MKIIATWNLYEIKFHLLSLALSPRLLCFTTLAAIVCFPLVLFFFLRFLVPVNKCHNHNYKYHIIAPLNISLFDLIRLDSIAIIIMLNPYKSFYLENNKSIAKTIWV